MAERMIQRACERFQKELSPQDANLIQPTTSLDEVKIAIQQIERQMAARQSLRNLQRITPFVDAIDRYSKAVEVAANGTPYLPWLWAPLKVILQGVHDCTHALDKILMAYGHIGSNMPRLSQYANAFSQHPGFQQLVAFLFEDIMEFHRKAYSLICKPGWKIFFATSWGMFEHRFESLLQNIADNSELIDKEAVALDILQAAEQRQREREHSMSREIQWKSEQLQSVLNWLETGESDPELKLEWLRSRCYEGTSQWITKAAKIRSWLQRLHGPNLLWLNGKPGSGKSVLSSQIIYFLRSDPTRNVLFYFCDFHTPAMGVTAHILKSLCSQLVAISTDLVPFVYNEYVSKGRKAVLSTLKEILPHLLACYEDVRIIVDGIDESPQGEHKALIKTLCDLTNMSPSCKTLLVSQDIPSIAASLAKKQRLCISGEKKYMLRDMEMVVDSSLTAINDMHNGVIEKAVLQSLKGKILDKAEGMFLWVRLVLDLLENAISVKDLRLQLNSLPKDLIEAYEKILGNMRSRCSAAGVMQIKRVFSWLLCQRGKYPLRKHQIRLGTDICKPFIEDDLNGSLIFIHSTVPQFLLAQGPTPFMDIQDSQRIVAFACVAQLNQALDLFSEGITFSEQCLHVCLGLCGLLPYATEHWISHLAECGTMGELEQQKGINELGRQLATLYHKIVSLEEDAQSSENSKKREQGTTRSNPYPEVRDFIGRWCQTQSSREAPNEIIGSIRVLTPLLSKYHDITRHILKQSSLSGASQLDLINFKEEYGPTAFVCQEPGCYRSLVGFPSERQLRDHADGHNKSLRCYEKDCTYNDVGFLTGRSLTSHKRKMHPTEQPKVIPKRLSSTNSSSEVIATDETSGWDFTRIDTGDVVRDFDFDSFLRDSNDSGGSNVSQSGANFALRNTDEVVPDFGFDEFLREGNGLDSSNVNQFVTTFVPRNTDEVVPDFDFDAFLRDGNDSGGSNVNRSGRNFAPGGIDEVLQDFDFDP